MKTYTVSIPAFCLLLISLIVPGLQAQNTSIGLKLGALQTIVPDNIGQNALGFRAGAFLTYSIEADYGVSGELNFARKGYRTNGDQRRNFDYVEVPLMGYYFFGEKGFRPKVMAGVFGAYLLGANQGETALTPMNEIDYGFVLGAGFHKSLGNRRWLNVDVRYTHGLQQVLNSPEVYNRDLAINLGITFPLELE